MALFHFCVKQISRGRGNRPPQSAIACAAYRAGERLYSDYYGDVSDYSHRRGVVYTEIMLPPQAPREYADRQTLWNAVEKAEKNSTAQLAYSFDIALQNELSREENIALARAFVRKNFVNAGMVADLCIHEKGTDENDIQNPHFHVMTTMRPINPDGTWGFKQHREYALDEKGQRIFDTQKQQYVFKAVPTTDWGRPETLERWRQDWAAICNDKFAEKGLFCRIENRSFERQGIDLIPTVHEGPAVRQMEAKGIVTEKGELNRWIKATNTLIQNLRRKIKTLIKWLHKEQSIPQKPPTPTLVDILSQYYSARNAIANSYSQYGSQKAKVGNLKKFAGSIQFLQSRHLNTLEQLESYLTSLSARVDTLKKSTQAKSDRMKELRELLRHAGNYERLRPVCDKMNTIHFKGAREKYRQANDSDLRLFYVARRHIQEAAGQDGKYSKKAWKEEYTRLQMEYAEESSQLKPCWDDLMQLLQVKRDVDTVMRDRQREEQSQSLKRNEQENYRDDR